MSSSDAKTIALRCLELTAARDLDSLGALLHERIVMRFPFSPEGMPNRCEGREQCLAMSRAFLSQIKSFEWVDLEAFATEDPEIVFLTARSKVETRSGKPYANQYCFKIRVRNGQVVEHAEFFNPLPVMAAFNMANDAAVG